MWRQVGLRRHADGLQDARARIAYWHHYLVKAPLPQRANCELANMLTVAALVTEAALARAESRGTHFRGVHIYAKHAAAMGAQQLNGHETNQAKTRHDHSFAQGRLNETNPLQRDRADHRENGVVIVNRCWDPGA